MPYGLRPVGALWITLLRYMRLLYILIILQDNKTAMMTASDATEEDETEDECEFCEGEGVLVHPAEVIDGEIRDSYITDCICKEEEDDSSED